MKPIIKDSYPEYYVETLSELDEIPVNAPSGTIALMNGDNGFKVYMKNENGDWKEL